MSSILIARRSLAAGALAAPFLSLRPAAAQTVTLRSADVQPDGYPTVEAVKYMSQLVEQRSNGRLRIQVYHSRQLGEEKDTVEQTRFGVIDMNRVNSGSFNNLVPETQIPGLPFLFRNTAHMHAVLDGPIGGDILKGLESHGLVGLCFYDSGARSFYTSKRAINTPADLRGLKIRVQQSDLFLAMMQALGANASPLPTGEVYSALQTGVVDGAENNWPSYRGFRHFEVAKYYSIDEHSMAPEVLVMSKRSFDRLTPELREVVRASARDSVGRMTELWMAAERESRAAVEAAGSMVNEVADKDAFMRAMEPVYARFVTSDRMRSLVNRSREQA